jgi:hypothetical protein
MAKAQGCARGLHPSTSAAVAHARLATISNWVGHQTGQGKSRGSSQHTHPAAPLCKSNLRIRLLDHLLFVGDPAPQDFTQLVKPYRL